MSNNVGICELLRRVSPTGESPMCWGSLDVWIQPPPGRKGPLSAFAVVFALIQASSVLKGLLRGQVEGHRASLPSTGHRAVVCFPSAPEGACVFLAAKRHWHRRQRRLIWPLDERGMIEILIDMESRDNHGEREYETRHLRFHV